MTAVQGMSSQDDYNYNKNEVSANQSQENDESGAISFSNADEESAQILGKYDTDGDGTVSVREFSDNFYNDYSKDIMAYYKSTGEAENIPDEQLQQGIKQAVDLMSKIIGMSDILENGDPNSVSVEELSNLLQYLDEYGWHEDADGNYTKDNNGSGKISKDAIIGFFDYCTDGGSRDLEYGSKYRTGQNISDQERQLINQYIVKPPLMALIDMANNFGIDLGKNSKYKDE